MKTLFFYTAAGHPKVAPPGVSGFLKKLWRLFYQTGSFVVSEDAPTKPELKTLHKTIKKITEDLERFSLILP